MYTTSSSSGSAKRKMVNDPPRGGVAAAAERHDLDRDVRQLGDLDQVVQLGAHQGHHPGADHYDPSAAHSVVRPVKRARPRSFWLGSGSTYSQPPSGCGLRTALCTAHARGR
jgi:hypothetical protein